jgi:hypothetical protein
MGLLRRPEAAALSISETSFAWMGGFFMMWYRIDCIAVAVVLLPAPLDQYQQLSRGTRGDKGERTWRRKTLDTVLKWCNRGYSSESRRAERAYLFGRISGLRAVYEGLGLYVEGAESGRACFDAWDCAEEGEELVEEGHRCELD